jgi:hypothetical protein
MVDAGERVEREIGDARTGIDENVGIDQHRRGSQVAPADATAAA